MRKTFVEELHKHMATNKDIYVLLGDLGWSWFDQIRKDYPERVINCGASEMAMMGIAVGLAKADKIPFCYSITTFLLYRPFEVIRNYLNNESMSVKLIGAGRDKDYHTEGFSHWSDDAEDILMNFSFNKFFPETKEEIPEIVDWMAANNKPCFLSLRK